jgi:hypothetical protein
MFSGVPSKGIQIQYCCFRNAERTPRLAGCSSAQMHVYSNFRELRIKGNCAVHRFLKLLTYLLLAIVAVAMSRPVDFNGHNLAPMTL